MYKLLFYELINKFIFLGGFSYEKDKETVSMFDRSSHHVYHGKYGVCGRYYTYRSGKAALSRVAVGATLLNLPVEGLKKVIIPLPDLESQKKIADQYYAKLSEIKELKYKLEKATEELEHIYTEEK